MVRFVHTADVQLLSTPLDAPGDVKARREARFNTLERIMQLAQDREADFIAVCGDLFEDNLVADEVVFRTLRILQDAAPLPVFVLPGNHDPLTSGSVYHRPAFYSDQRPDNVRVLTSADPVAVSDDCTLYPCPVRSKTSLRDPTEVIPARERAEDIRIGLAHGAVMIPTMFTADDHPIPLEVVTMRGLDYLALGHNHGRVIWAGNRMAYPGTPEQTKFGEKDAGGVLVVEIERAGAVPDIVHEQVGELRWLEWTRDVREPLGEALARVRAEVEAIPDRGETLFRLTIRGAVTADSLPQLGELRAWLSQVGFLRAELHEEAHCLDELAGALKDLAALDEVIAGTVADLQRLGAPDAPPAEAEAPPRGIEELLGVWADLESTDASVAGACERADAVREAQVLLARIAGEVQQ